MLMDGGGCDTLFLSLGPWSSNQTCGSLCDFHNLYPYALTFHSDR